MTAHPSNAGKPLVETILDGLEANSFGEEHIAAVQLANSAPELLSALEALLDHVTQFQNWQRDGKPCGELFKNLDTTRAKAAIAQAKSVAGHGGLVNFQR